MKFYKDGKSMDASKEQFEVLEEDGWSRKKPEKKVEEVPEEEVPEEEDKSSDKKIAKSAAPLAKKKIKKR